MVRQWARRLLVWSQTPDLGSGDANDRRRILYVLAAPILIAAIYGHLIPPPDPPHRYAATVALLVSLWRARRGRFLMASLVIPSGMILILLETALKENGIHNTTLLGLPAAVAVAGLLTGPRGATLFGVIGMLGLVGLYGVEAAGVIHTPWSSELAPASLITALLLMAINTVTLSLTIWRLERSLQQSRGQAASLRESEARWRSLILDAPLIVIRIDRDLRIAFINLDPQGSRLMGTGFDELFPGESRTVAIDRATTTLKEGGTTSFEAQMELPGGPVLWYSVHLGPIRVDEDIVGASLLCIDITERRRARHEREALIRELGLRNSELERYTYTASHELKTPLITIRSFAGLVEREAAALKSDRIQAHATRIANAASRMNERLGALLTLARLGRIADPTQTLSLTVLANEAVDLCAGALTFGGVAVKVQAGMPEVRVDRVRFVEVFQNLIENAIKFTRNQGAATIEIGMRGEGGERTFFVKDNGIGIAPRFHEKVFGLFDKLDPKSDGSGVGLAVVRRIVEVHGGRIWIESEGPGHGTTFCFTQPPVGPPAG